MQQFAIRALSDKPVGLENPRVELDTGFNVFNIVTDDLQEVLDRLRKEGVRIIDMKMMQSDKTQTLKDMLTSEESALMGPSSRLPDSIPDPRGVLNVGPEEEDS